MSSKAIGPGSNEPFTFTTESGKTFTVPSMARIKAGLIRRTRKLEPDDKMFTIIEALADDDALAAIDEMEAGELERFGEEWSEHSGTDLGESAAS